MCEEFDPVYLTWFTYDRSDSLKLVIFYECRELACANLTHDMKNGRRNEFLVFSTGLRHVKARFSRSWVLPLLPCPSPASNQPISNLRTPPIRSPTPPYTPYPPRSKTREKYIKLHICGTRTRHRLFQSASQ